MNYFFKPIGTIRTHFSEKFGVPKQSMLVKEAKGVVVLNREFSQPETVLKLEEFSHIWILFLFNQIQNENHPHAWRPTIIPPSVFAPKKVGVFASRSPHRPNPIGMSAVKLEKVCFGENQCIEIHVSGVDILNDTPVLDIKPYLPFADRIEEANHGWAKGEQRTYPVHFSPNVLQFIRVCEIENKYPNVNLQKMIEQLLTLDPRPRSQKELAPMAESKSIGRKFAFRVLDLDLHWSIGENASIHLNEIKILSF